MTTQKQDLHNIYNNLYERHIQLTHRITNLHNASNIVHNLNPTDLLHAYKIIDKICNKTCNDSSNDNIINANAIIDAWYQYHANLELNIVNRQLKNIEKLLETN